MFAGISQIIMNDDNTEVIGMTSKEGETVPFKTTVSLKNEPKINEWLTSIENEMRLTLAKLNADAVSSLKKIHEQKKLDTDLITFIDSLPTQVGILSLQIIWTDTVENVLRSKDIENGLNSSLSSIEHILSILAESVLQNLSPLLRRKVEHVITELVHQRDVLREIIAAKAKSHLDFIWLSQMRFFYNPSESNLLKSVTVSMADAIFDYGFEYLGAADRLVQTPLTDRCYLTLTQALQSKLGGSPSGPVQMLMIIRLVQVKLKV